MRHVDKELSAYLDNECRRPERIEAHLRECARCTARLDDLRTLSTALRTLRRPDVRPEFVTRVIAEAREDKAGGARFRWAWPAATAAFCVLVAGAAVVALHANKGGTRGDEYVAQTLEQRPDFADAIENLVEAIPVESDPGDVPDEVVADMVCTGLFAMLADEADAPGDLDSIVENMNAAELAEFKQLLRQYEEEV